MATTGQKYTATITTDSGGVEIANPTNAQGAPNGVLATSTLDGTTERLICSGHDFRIPSGSTINGITMTIVAKGGLIV